jgi:uncharacterized protein (DUF1800 family)
MVGLEPFKGNFGIEQAALLARHTGFGATAYEINQSVDDGLEKTLEGLFSYTLAAHQDNPFSLNHDLIESEALRHIQKRWLFEMIHSPFAFREKLALVWSNYFVVGIDKVRDSIALAQYLQTFYKHGLGSFENLTLKVSKTPAMLHYLDNKDNKKDKPNENFARELLELFTLGIGHYNETDVSEAAKAFTGWTYKSSEGNPKFVFDQKQHDTGLKIFLGHSSNFTGQEIITICAKHPATAKFVCSKLWRAFVSDVPDKTEVENLAQVFTESQGNIQAVLGELFSSQAFFNSPGKIIKSPLEFVVGTFRNLGITPLGPETYKQLYYALLELGQVPLGPPDVSGWPGGKNWINDSTLLTRIYLARRWALLEPLPFSTLSPQDLNVALFGRATTHLEESLQGRPFAERLFLLLSSPEYMLS